MKKLKTLQIPEDLGRELLYTSTFNREIFGALFAHFEKAKGVAVGHYPLAVGTRTAINGLDLKRVEVFNRLLKIFPRLGGSFYHTHPTSGTREEAASLLDFEDITKIHFLSDQFSTIDEESFIKKANEQLSPKDYDELLISHKGITRYSFDPKTKKIMELKGLILKDYCESGEFQDLFERGIADIYSQLLIDQRPDPIVLKKGLRELILK
tara:strand:+ start:85 stop:714 length:630 start_codon:yes stop_codon:yes gene_type:complete